jgi:hypothetical protein
MPGRIESMGATPATRCGLFFGICIWVRIAVAVGVLAASIKYYNETLIAILLVCGAVVITNITYRPSEVWWSRNTHVAVGISIMISAIVGLATKSYVAPFVVFGLLLLDVFSGIARSLAVMPFRA